MKSVIERLSRLPHWRNLEPLADWVVAQAVTIQQIPAPTFEEATRAAYVEGLFQEFGLQDVHMDDMLNVYGFMPGATPDSPAMMVAAHTDTVFSMDTDLTIRRQNGLIYGPGLGDNSMGVAGLLGLLKALYDSGYQPKRGIWFVATSREEGLGDLDGMRAAYKALKDRINGVVNLEGLAFGHIYHAGIAVKRLKITATTDGGHSWLHFGRPSAIHGLMRLGTAISDIIPPSSPRTTYNIGLVEGGQSINTVAAEASMWLDMRSEDVHQLDRLERQVQTLVDTIATTELRFNTRVVGNRPAGHLATHHPLVTGALTALEQVGLRGTLETGSTDGNIPLADGCPTVTIGITRGGNAHRLDEYIEVKPVSLGLRQLILLVIGATEQPDW